MAMRRLQRFHQQIAIRCPSRALVPLISGTSSGGLSQGIEFKSIIHRPHHWRDSIFCSQRKFGSVALVPNSRHSLSWSEDERTKIFCCSITSEVRRERQRKSRTFIVSIRTLKTSKAKEGLTVAIIGSGPAGLSSALHLAPLVESGVIQGPIHLYESINELGAPVVASHRVLDSTILDYPDGDYTLDQEERHYDVIQGTGTTGRDVGVGIWSTALTPFHLCEISQEEEGEKKEIRPSHHILLRSIHDAGTYVDKVGYRTPDGSFLARSQLSTLPIIPPNLSAKDLYANNDTNQERQEPGLIFLPENKLMEALHKAVGHEIKEQKTIMKIQQTIELIICDDLPTSSSQGRRRGGGGRLVFVDGTQSDEKYSLILGAGGTHSILRKRYSRHMDHTYKLKFGISLNPNRPDGSKEGGCKRVAPVALSKKNTNKFLNELSSLPLTEDMEDRGYVVFRGNAPIPLQQDHHAFQTWGTNHALRFATVPCKIPIVKDEDSANEIEASSSSRIKDVQEGQVWFFTTNDDNLLSSILNQDDLDDSTKGEWKRKLVEYVKAQNWHDPVAQVIEATPSSQMWMESALAHQYAAAALGGGFEQHYERDDENGEVMFHHVQSDEPLLVYVGDADMTVDPVLAQGITIAMEDAADVARCVREASRQVEAKVEEQSANFAKGEIIRLIGRDGIEKSIHQVQYETLRMALKDRHDEKMGRLVCLLRATELVQTLAQPNSSFTGIILKAIIRPLMRYGAPQSVKRTVFDWMLKYSLGWFQKKL